jgi:hypothetical protein
MEIRLMTRLVAVLTFVAFALALAPLPALSQVQPRTCGALDGPGCNPYRCSPLDGPGCQAQAQAGVGEGMQLTLGVRAALDAKRPNGQVNTIHDMFAVLRSCWTPPASENAQRGMQMSLRFSFNTAGNLIGDPRVTYATHEVSQKTRDLYREAFEHSLRDCTPIAFSKGFAGAIAGRPIVVRIIDNRGDAGAAKLPI